MKKTIPILTPEQHSRRAFLKRAAGTVGAATGLFAVSYKASAQATGFNGEAAVAGVKALREQSYSCAQATFVGLAREIKGLDEAQMHAVSAGFAGGIGRTFNEGTCGALTGGVMALGLAFNGSSAGIDASKTLFERFKAREGTVICQAILKKYGGFGHCTQCCLDVAADAAELIAKK